MPFESLWARIPLTLRWGVSLLLGVVLIVLLVRFVTHNSNNGEAHLSQAGLKHEAQEDAIIVGQDQAPVSVHVGAAKTARTVLVTGVRDDMRHRIADGSLPGPLRTVRCFQSGAQGPRIAYHCTAKAGNLVYPFVAAVTAREHRAVFCKKDFSPVPSENIPVSARCLL